jgi:hypothetical protein
MMIVIDSKSLERDAGGKPVSTFPHPALEVIAMELGGRFAELSSVPVGCVASRPPCPTFAALLV